MFDCLHTVAKDIGCLHKVAEDSVSTCWLKIVVDC